MPLTLPTHPVAVLPLKVWRPRWFDGVALTVGAVAPDLAYAVYGFAPVLRTHNLLAVLWWGVPVTLVVTGLVRWAAPVVAAHLPGGGRLRLGDYGVLGAVRHPWAVTVVSAAIGAFSHVAWDSVTHATFFPVLRREVWPGMPWWGLFSDASNIAGFVAGAMIVVHLGRSGLIRRWHGPPPEVARRPVVFWAVVVAVLLAGLTTMLAFPVDWYTGTAIRALLIGGLALVGGAAAGRILKTVDSSVSIDQSR